ncbi:MAG TPA: hypothetical protein VFX15_13080 [Actinomycetes bacterium]|nr:hypothetical protein [Actinomycetes bacterium]
MPSLRLLPDLEESIRQIPGVRAVSVVTDAQAQPREVHVLAAPGKPAKQIVRDVQSLAMAQFNIDLDHRIVSVVQIEDEPGGSSDAPESLIDLSDAEVSSAEEVLDEIEAQARPVITEIGVRSTGSEIEVEVRLQLDDDTFVGIERGAAANSARPRLVASATVSALDDLLGVPAAVESAAIVDTGTHAVALVVLTLSIPRIGAQSVAGSAVVRGDETDAVARAALAAVNRRLG